jgi:hypothetical protein
LARGSMRPFQHRVWAAAIAVAKARRDWPQRHRAHRDRKKIGKEEEEREERSRKGKKLRMTEPRVASAIDGLLLVRAWAQTRVSVFPRAEMRAHREGRPGCAVPLRRNIGGGRFGERVVWQAKFGTSLEKICDCTEGQVTRLRKAGAESASSRALTVDGSGGAS